MYRLQWDLNFGVRSSTATIGHAKVNAFGDLFVPLTPNVPDDSASSILHSRALRFGVNVTF